MLCSFATQHILGSYDSLLLAASKSWSSSLQSFPAGGKGWVLSAAWDMFCAILRVCCNEVSSRVCGPWPLLNLITSPLVFA